jgi:hypothetical protein
MTRKAKFKLRHHRKAGQIAMPALTGVRTGGLCLSAGGTEGTGTDNRH